jgi:hypothetical protein
MKVKNNECVLCKWKGKTHIHHIIPLSADGKDVFEYSVFGSPQQKIGDFTQSKLSGWSQ